MQYWYSFTLCPKALLSYVKNQLQWISILDSLNLYPLPDNQKLFLTNFRDAVCTYKYKFISELIFFAEWTNVTCRWFCSTIWLVPRCQKSTTFSTDVPRLFPPPFCGESLGTRLLFYPVIYCDTFKALLFLTMATLRGHRLISTNNTTWINCQI